MCNDPGEILLRKIRFGGAEVDQLVQRLKKFLAASLRAAARTFWVEQCTDV